MLVEGEEKGCPGGGRGQFWLVIFKRPIYSRCAVTPIIREQARTHIDSPDGKGGRKTQRWHVTHLTSFRGLWDRVVGPPMVDTFGRILIAGYLQE